MRHDIIEYAEISSVIGRTVTVTVDRPLGSYHPEHKDMYYPINYGYVEGIMAPDGEEQDAYILGVDEAIEKFTGKIIAIVHRNDDVEEKWVVAPEGMTFTKQYVTSNRVIGNNDIITIDLSPQMGNIWGDYARTIIVENGKVVEDIGLIENPEWKSGLQMEEKLHAELLRFATKETTFEKLYYHMNEFIVENGFVNLDFMGNLGHSIVKTKGDRIYIEKENKTKLGDVKYFTFEPHISFPDSKYGYKKENIYYFNENGLMEL